MRRLIFILLASIGVSQAQTIQYIGAPTTTVISRGNFRTDSIFYLPKRSKAPTDTAAFRYQISDSSLYVWTGSQWIKAGGSGLVDTTVLSTRLWRQKGIDSLGAVKQNVLTNPITGTGTTNTIVKFASSTTVDNSGITEDGAKILYSGNLGLGTISSPNGKLDIGVVAGSGSVSATYSSTAWDDVASNGTKFAFRQRFASYDVGNITMQRDGAESRGILSFNLSTDWSSAAPVEVFRITSAKEFFINTTTDAGDYKLQVSGNIYNTGSITTGAPSGGSVKPWKIGEAATVSPTSPNRTLRVEVDGVVYYIHAKTTND